LVAECFNDFFINVAKDIGNVTVVDKNHPSIIEINKNKKDIPNLEFKEISDEFVHKQINKTSAKKATIPVSFATFIKKSLKHSDNMKQPAAILVLPVL
jgi:hypothetical protein